MNIKYIISLLAIAIVAVLGAHFMVLKNDPTEQFWYYGGVALFLLLGLAVGKLYDKSVEASNSVFYRRVMGATGLRMFFCLVYVLIYVVVSELRAVEFVVFFLISYLLFTIFEIYQIVSKLRPEK